MSHSDIPIYCTKATMIGSLAILMWSFSAILVTELDTVPIFQLIALMQTFGVIAAALYFSLSRKWGSIGKPSWIWIIPIVGILGNDIFYVAAFKHAPAAHVDLINYLWPILIVIFAPFLPGERYSIYHMLAALMGLTAMYVLLYQETGAFQWQYLPGYLSSVMAAVVWTSYVLLSRYTGKITLDIVAMVMAVGAVFSWALHGLLETTVPLTAWQWLLMSLLGCTVHLAAYVCWQHGINQGNFKLISILAYFTAIFSVGLLIVFGKAEATSELMIALALVTLGSFIASWAPLPLATEL